MLNNSWKTALSDILNDELFINFYREILNLYEDNIIYPNKDEIFNCLDLTSFEDVNVVILGQDPYHNKGQANGLAFSVNNGVPLPPSLKNIFEEIENDLGIKNTNGDLTKWAKQGVLLLNTTLTVYENKPNSFSNSYWKVFTDEVIKKCSEKGNIIFLLWGNEAKKKKKLISDNNYILETSHPSPLSVYRGFRGSKIFSKTNEILHELGKEEINWET